MYSFFLRGPQQYLCSPLVRGGGKGPVVDKGARVERARYFSCIINLIKAKVTRIINYGVRISERRNCHGLGSYA